MQNSTETNLENDVLLKRKQFEMEILRLSPPELHQNIKAHFELMRGEIAEIKRKWITKHSREK